MHSIKGMKHAADLQIQSNRNIIYCDPYPWHSCMIISGDDFPTHSKVCVLGMNALNYGKYSDRLRSARAVIQKKIDMFPGELYFSCNLNSKKEDT